MKKPKHISQEDWDSVDNPPLTDDELAAMRPAREVLPASFFKAMGRPKSKSPKKSITIRLDSSVIEAFKARGKGWQTQINNLLRASLETHA
ncbi:MAG: BrnA antitoxin family protein [Pseudomonadota bacterium]